VAFIHRRSAHVISRLVVAIAFLGSLGAAFATKDWERPEGRRVHVQGRRFLQRSAGLPHFDGVAPPLEQPTAEPAKAKPVVEPGPVKPKTQDAPAPIALRAIEDIELCPAENGVEPEFRRSCEVHFGPDGELSWHDADKGGELESLRALGQSLNQRTDVQDVVLVPDRLTPWIWVRYAIVTAQKNERGTFWIGVGSADEPQRLRVLPLPQVASGDHKPPTEDVFLIHVDEVEGGGAFNVNGESIESFPFDLASAWTTWKKAHAGADTSSPDATPVLIESSRDVSAHVVIRLLDVLKKLGVESVQLVGDLGRMPK
jgi:biopolymer transport protein ExbD